MGLICARASEKVSRSIHTNTYRAARAVISNLNLFIFISLYSFLLQFRLPRTSDWEREIYWFCMLIQERISFIIQSKYNIWCLKVVHNNNYDDDHHDFRNYYNHTSKSLNKIPIRHTGRGETGGWEVRSACIQYTHTLHVYISTYRSIINQEEKEVEEENKISESQNNKTTHTDTITKKNENYRKRVGCCIGINSRMISTISLILFFLILIIHGFLILNSRQPQPAPHHVHDHDLYLTLSPFVSLSFLFSSSMCYLFLFVFFISKLTNIKLTLIVSHQSIYLSRYSLFSSLFLIIIVEPYISFSLFSWHSWHFNKKKKLK